MNEATTSKLAADFKILIDDVEELVKATADQAGERIGNLRQRLEKKIVDGRKALAEREFGWFEKAKQAKKRAEPPAPEYTWTELVIASAIGVLIGLLLRRRRLAK